MVGTYSIINGQKVRIAPYITKAAIQSKIDGLLLVINLLTDDTEANPTLKAKIISGWEEGIKKLENKLEKTRY